MSTIDCATFTAVLTELLAEPSPDRSDARLATLRAHAAACPECAHVAGLVEMAGEPADRRDPVDDPGPEYWRAFHRRLHARLESRSKRAPLFAAGVAAMLAGTALLVALLRTPGETPPFLPETPPDHGDILSTDESDDDLSGFEEAGPIDAFSEDDRAGIFPTVEQLSPDDAQRFLEWLEEEEARVKKGDT